MAFYIAIYEDYTVKKISGIKAVVEFANVKYRLQNGKELTFDIVAKALKKDGFINLYDYDNETLNGLLTSKIQVYDRGLPDWYCKIQKVD